MTALLCDGPNVLVRAVRAFEAPGAAMLSADGVATGPLLVFINTLARYIASEKADKVLVAWDGGASAYRRGIYPDYKIARHEVKSELETSAFGLAKRFCTLAGINHIEHAHVEADDIIAYHSRRERPAVLLSSDKDLTQLITPRVQQVRLSSSGTPTDRWSYERVLDVFDCAPHQLGHVMALAGDPGDGVPGVPRVGMKTAVKLLARNEWDFDAALVIEPLLKPHADLARMSHKLVDLQVDLPGLVLSPLPRFAPTGPSSVFYQDLLEFLTRYRMESIKDRLYQGTLWHHPGAFV